MEYAMKAREEYLDAIGQAHGEAYKAGTTVDHRGATQFVVKTPDEESPQLVSIGHLKIMTQRLLDKQVEHKLAA